MLKQVVLRDGVAVVEQVPAPVRGSGQVLVRTEWSVVSSGTERAVLDATGKSLVSNARERPEQLKRAIEVAQRDGYLQTYRRIRGTIKAGFPTGYSAAGIVLETDSSIQDIRSGDRVAIAGAGYANHAEYNVVPRNLVCKLPSGVSTQHGSITTLGAIAMQGVRRTEVVIGDWVAVVGLGILGQLTVQILKAAGCRVIAIDTQKARADLARSCGADLALSGNKEEVQHDVRKMTADVGADAVIATAASSSPEVISLCMNLARKRGRVTVVGDVSLDIKRADMYVKELDLRMSTSYGPGRYDPKYEEEGVDYPIAYVRWTEQRNMESFLSLVAQGSINFQAIPQSEFAIENASKAYASIGASENASLLTFLHYETSNGESPGRTTSVSRSVNSHNDRIRVAVVGASSFAQSTHLPNLKRLKEDFHVEALVTRTPTNALSVARRFDIPVISTDIDEVLNSPDIDLVLIATRHNLHGGLVRKSLSAGKNVLVEKPLTLNPTDLTWLEDFYSADEGQPMLTVGYNRRFSPAAQILKREISPLKNGAMVSYVVNAGSVGPDHWTIGPEGGGRNLGEACHMYDLMTFLLGSNQDFDTYARGVSVGLISANDNFATTIDFGGESLGHLLYTNQGSPRFPKETICVFVDGQTHTLRNFQLLESAGQSGALWKSRKPEKGHLEMLQAIGTCLRDGSEWPIPFSELLRVSNISFAVESALQSDTTG